MMQNTTKTQSSSETRGFWIWQGIIVAASPVIGYGLAFVYELGFCQVFDIPTEFITLNLTSVFIAAGSLIGIVLILYWFAELFLMLVPARKPPLFRELVFLLILLLFNLGFIILWWGMWERVIYVIFTLIFFAMLLFVFPLITQKGKGSYIEKLQAQRKRDLETPMVIFESFVRLIGRKTFLIIFVLVCLVFFSYIAGDAKAIKQEEFLIPSTYPQAVVLRIYGENMICAPFDGEKKEIQKSFFIIRMTDEPRPMLQLQKIGPLRVKGEQ